MFKKKHVFALAAASLLAGLSGCGDNNTTLSFPAAATLFASDGVNLSTINSQSRLMADTTAISGLAAGTTVVGLDFNPNGGALVALGSDGSVYTINTSNAAATAIGKDSSTSFANKVVDIDFNPRVQNVFRVVTSTLENFRQRGNVPATSTTPAATPGQRITTGSTCSPSRDCGFVYVTGDSNAGKTLAITGAAYTNSGLNGGTLPPTTNIFVIDVQNNVLARLGSAPANGTAGDPGNPNEGLLTTIGALGVDLDGNTPFDIDSAGNGFVVGRLNGDLHLFTVNLSTGALADAGLISPAAGNLVTMAVQQR